MNSSEQIMSSDSNDFRLESSCVSIHDVLKAAKSFLVSCSVDDAAADAWYLLEYVTGISRADYLADRERIMSEKERDAYTALIKQRGSHIPFQYLTGEQEFMGIPFLVNPDVLIPRCDTETLAEKVLERILFRLTDLGDTDRELLYVLDLCTGSGCLAVSIAKLTERWRRKNNVTKKIKIFASDISEAALMVAKENAKRQNADIHFILSDLFDNICNTVSTKGERCNRGFDIIVSNPPYIRTSVIGELSEEVRLHEPLKALDGGGDGLEFYRRITKESRKYLNPNGELLLEIGYDQADQVSDLMWQNGFLDVQVTKDLSGNDRVLSGHY